jgi:hypothetical protein
VVALRCDFFNCWSIGLALPSPACRLSAPDWAAAGCLHGCTALRRDGSLVRGCAICSTVRTGDGEL